MSIKIKNFAEIKLTNVLDIIQGLKDAGEIDKDFNFAKIPGETLFIEVSFKGAGYVITNSKMRRLFSREDEMVPKNMVERIVHQI